MDPKTLGFYVTLGQVGLEMVAPVILGLILDHTFDWTPWATVSGAVLGFVGGLGHLIKLLHHPNRPGDGQPPLDRPR